MKIVRRLILILGMCAALVASVFVVASATPAQAAVTCERGFGTKIPVLMVHGFNGDIKIWDQGDSGSMVGAVNSIPGADAVAAFNYKDYSWEWVTHPQIGPRLADTIHCLASASRQNGGIGKVIVIAHSMGGLALREAMSHTIDGRSVANDVGLVITIGTPHLGSRLADIAGSGLAQLCRSSASGGLVNASRCYRSTAIRGMMQGSQELADLPRMPSAIPLRALAGDVTLYRFWDNGTDLDSDIVVKVGSATAEYTTHHPGDGKFVFACTAETFWFYIGPATCGHSALVGNAGVQARVIQAIAEYLQSLGSPEPSPSPTPGPTSSPNPTPTPEPTVTPTSTP